MAKIGITFSHYHLPDDEDNVMRMEHYFRAIEDAGGQPEPLWLPADGDPDDALARKMATQLDGLLVSGGADLPPSFYGQDLDPNAHVKLVPPARPAYEAALLREFLARNKPAFGICYGCQFFNVWRGGTLIQDIPSQWPEPIEHGQSRHPVRVLHHTLLNKIIEQEEFEVVSSHHQAICHLAHGGETAAFAPDRLAEAVEFEDQAFFIGVQWHPERDRASAATQRLFGAFIKAARGATTGVRTASVGAGIAPPVVDRLPAPAQPIHPNA